MLPSCLLPERGTRNRPVVGPSLLYASLLPSSGLLPSGLSDIELERWYVTWGSVSRYLGRYEYMCVHVCNGWLDMEMEMEMRGSRLRLLWNVGC